MAVGEHARVVMIDNYDSFTFNLVQYLLELGAQVEVVRNDATDAQGVLARAPTHVVLSPGPGTPAESGVCRALCEVLATRTDVPLLGVCLGHQTLCEVLGGRVGPAPRIMHDGLGVFTGLPSPFRATRYHSLVAFEPLPPVLVACAHTPEGELMGVRAVHAPLHGVQFHPESILSEHGHALLANVLALAPPAGAP
jgi:anthranilate synthase component 2